MRIYYCLFLLLTSFFLKAQILDHTAISIAYRTIPKHSFLQAGLELKPPSKNIDDSPFTLGTSLLYTRIDHKDKIIPEVSVQYSRLGLMGISVNPYSIEPRIGFSCFNMFFINTGYSIPIDKDKNFKGVSFGFQINIPLKKNSYFYDKFRLM